MIANMARRALTILVAVAICSGTSAAATAAAPTGGFSSDVALHGTDLASGTFTALVDFSTLELRAVGERTCELTVDGRLVFDGSLVGSATGTTTALVLASCADVAGNLPGTFRDVFRFEGDFTGTVNGEAVTADLTYFGISRPGGAIDALMRLGDGARALLRVDAVVAVGGTYAGVAVH